MGLLSRVGRDVLSGAAKGAGVGAAFGGLVGSDEPGLPGTMMDMGLESAVAGGALGAMAGGRRLVTAMFKALKRAQPHLPDEQAIAQAEEMARRYQQNFIE
jgi:hypothetical protein